MEKKTPTPRADHDKKLDAEQRGNGSYITPAQKAKAVTKFLAKLAGGMSIKQACIKSGLKYRTAYDLRANDSEFAAAWDAAIEEGSDELEDRLTDHAKKMKDMSSVTAAIFLLKARRPEKFRERFDNKNTHSLVAHEDAMKALK